MKTLVSLTIAGLLVFGATSSAKAQRWLRGYDDDFATEYCRYYKTRAYYARRQERAGKYARKKSRRAAYLWKQYIACLERYGTPDTFIPRW